jgi:hypothetical protein
MNNLVYCLNYINPFPKSNDTGNLYLQTEILSALAKPCPYRTPHNLPPNPNFKSIKKYDYQYITKSKPPSPITFKVLHVSKCTSRH